ncbi:unnamed protein product [Heligmosomoides polygyrus]|uniref:Uncharacterized protein n=1 Tax=Heligmosomoides polygyrus TaxID=6339 RepID=A0A183F6I6_HELPZ|nr:unnamed protein product [Heligmosomoides polygyrus]
MPASVPAARSKGGVKRFCPANSPSSPSIDPVRLTDALKEVNESPAVPACVKNASNSLVDELTSLKRERDKLLGIAAVQPTDERDLERLRSVVISGIPELDSTDIESRVRYDFFSVGNVLFHIEVECLLVTVYRLGRPIIGNSRLLEVVLPSSRFQRLAVNCQRGVYIRESLSQEERVRRREAYRSLIVNSFQNVMLNTSSVQGN